MTWLSRYDNEYMSSDNWSWLECCCLPFCLVVGCYRMREKGKALSETDIKPSSHPRKSIEIRSFILIYRRGERYPLRVTDDFTRQNLTRAFSVMPTAASRTTHALYAIEWRGTRCSAPRTVFGRSAPPPEASSRHLEGSVVSLFKYVSKHGRGTHGKRCLRD